MKKLSESEIQERLKALPGWYIKNGQLHKDFKFSNFKEAMKFINRLAATAEELNHHPDWSNSYNKVSINLVSHELNGLTETDFLFAKEADKVAQN